MIENIKNLTNDFIENEKSVLQSEFNLRTSVYPEEPELKETSKEVVETVNEQLVSLNERHTSDKLNTSEISIITDDKTDYSGVTPKRYTTTCWIQRKTLPYWYSENLLLFINSTKRLYEDKIYFREKQLPVKWSENMTTEVSLSDNQYFRSSVDIPVTDVYIPLEQVAV